MTGRRTRSRRRPTRRQRNSRLPLALLIALFAGAALVAVSAGRVTTARSLGALDWPELPKLALPQLSIPLPDLAGRLRHPRLHLRAIDFLGLQTVTSAELVRLVDLPRPIALIDVDPGAVCEALSGHPRVGECSALRLPPGRLIIAIEEREPLALLESTQQGIDADGQRFDLGDGELTGLPRVSGEPRRAVQLARAARDAGVELSRITADGADGLVFEPADRAVRVRVVGDPKRALEAWLRLERSGLLYEHDAREVDLRFRGSAVLRDFRDNKGGNRDGSP